MRGKKNAFRIEVNNMNRANNNASDIVANISKKGGYVEYGKDVRTGRRRPRAGEMR